MRKIALVAVGLILSGPVLAGDAHSVNLQPGAAQQAKLLDRHTAVYKLVMKWGPLASRVQGRSISEWGRGLVPVLGTASEGNLNKALAADTYGGMINALVGGKSVDTALLPGGYTAESLGSMTADLTYTPLPNCVIVNTSNAGGGGAFAAEQTRHYKASGPSFVTQGGEDSNCGIPTGVRALLMNIQAKTPTSNGYFRTWPYGTPLPLAASLSYTSGQGIQNEIILSVSTGDAADFSVYSKGNAHFIASVLGYFAAPQATALECVTGDQFDHNGAYSAVNIGTYACPAGYGQVGLNCFADAGTVSLRGESNGTCMFINSNTTDATNYHTSQRCCRVPGR